MAGIEREMDKQKLFKKLQSGTRNLSFGDMVRLVEAFGFELARINGSHHIFEHQQVSELVNLQNYKGQAKPYQINQFLRLVKRYHLEMEDS
jgi:predicted RNA binding protein YcfA (HicA-like mRNA interferase family)